MANITPPPAFCPAHTNCNAQPQRTRRVPTPIGAWPYKCKTRVKASRPRLNRLRTDCVWASFGQAALGPFQPPTQRGSRSLPPRAHSRDYPVDEVIRWNE